MDQKLKRIQWNFLNFKEGGEGDLWERRLQNDEGMVYNRGKMERGGGMLQMIATDMDGTLMDEQGEVDHERLSCILDQLDQRGIPFVIATGNGYSRMAHVLGDLKDRVTLVLANGATDIREGKAHPRVQLAGRAGAGGLAVSRRPRRRTSSGR